MGPLALGIEAGLYAHCPYKGKATYRGSNGKTRVVAPDIEDRSELRDP
jgi:hypothetical protein